MLTNRCIPLAALFALLCPLSLAGQPAQCPAYTTSLPLTTGVDPAAALLPGGSKDLRWTVLEDPFSSTVEPRPADVLTNPPLGSWATIPQSKWISSQADSTQGTNGNYFYRACFCLRDGFSNPSLKLDLRADDQADVFLNNTLAQIKSGPPPAPILNGAASSFLPSKTPDHLVYTGPFKFGENCLIVRVRNTGGGYTGLDLVGSITATGPGSAASGVLKPECCQKTGSICGMKWNDLNHDGVHQSTEPGLQGWTIQLSNGQTALTDQFGQYCFSDLTPGGYTVTEQPQAGWVQTLPKAPGKHSATVAAATATGGLDFGNCKGPECGPVLPSCTLTGNVVSACCLGPVPCPGSGGSLNFYSFLASVTLSGTPSCTLTATSTTTGLVIGSYGPAMLAAGANFVTGTFSAPQSSSPFNLTLSCQGGGGVRCSTALTAPLPACTASHPDQGLPAPVLQ